MRTISAIYSHIYVCTYFWDILKHYPYSIITELKMNSKLGEIICKIRASDYEVNTQYHTPYIKVGFCQKVWHGSKKYSKSLPWAENLNFLPTAVNNLFKFCAPDSDLKYFLAVSSSLKKLPLHTYYICTNYTVAYN